MIYAKAECAAQGGEEEEVRLLIRWPTVRFRHAPFLSHFRFNVLHAEVTSCTDIVRTKSRTEIHPLREPRRRSVARDSSPSSSRKASADQGPGKTRSPQSVLGEPGLGLAHLQHQALGRVSVGDLQAGCRCPSGDPLCLCCYVRIALLQLTQAVA